MTIDTSIYSQFYVVITDKGRFDEGNITYFVLSKAIEIGVTRLYTASNVVESKISLSSSYIQNVDYIVRSSNMSDIDFVKMTVYGR